VIETNDDENMYSHPYSLLAVKSEVALHVAQRAGISQEDARSITSIVLDATHLVTGLDANKSIERIKKLISKIHDIEHSIKAVVDPMLSNHFSVLISQLEDEVNELNSLTK